MDSHNAYQQLTHGSAIGSRSQSSQVDRKTSRRRSEVRHGHIYENTRSQPQSRGADNTIRAVTPDSAASNADITALPSPPPVPYQNQTPTALFHVQEPSPSVSNTDEEGTIDSRRRKTKKKVKHHDNLYSDTSPNSFFERTRKRLNSITTASISAPHHDEPTASIGFPNVVQASVFPDLHDMRQTLPRPQAPRRAFSSDNPSPSPNASQSALRSPVSVESDADKILKLMKTLNGRMHGILFYRPIGTTAWYSGYCAINVSPGSLICQARGDVTKTDVLVPDLRGCTVRTHFDSAEQSAYLSVVLPVSGLGYQLRPPVPETFESWLAALLCWQPLKPKGVHNKMAKPQSIAIGDKTSLTNNRRLSDVASPKSTAVVKSSQMFLWDGTLPASSRKSELRRPRTGQSNNSRSSSWRRVNCTLHENGILRLLAEENATTLRKLTLSNFARCAVQRLDQSVLGVANCIAIHPQYTITPSKATSTTPLVISLSSKVAFEAWFVLLQAMTVPELYGPETETSRKSEIRYSIRDMFRIERSLYVRIVEARFREPHTAHGHRPIYTNRPDLKATERNGVEVYADVMLGRDLRARTVHKPFSSSIFWADEFCLSELPSMISRISVVLKMGNPDDQEWTTMASGEYEVHETGDTPNFEALEIVSHDPVFGKVEMSLVELEQDKCIEKWWPLMDTNGNELGSALIKLNLDERVVLMGSEYTNLSALLHNFDNSVTSQIGQVIGSDIKALSDVFLDIFQATQDVEEWINTLIEEEIDGIYREQPPMRMRFSGRIHSNDSYETAEQRELLVRDLSRSATMEANLLFRGNSLITKALDAHMQRLGREYLEATIGPRLRDIVAKDPNCEVDPNRVKSSEQLEKNWTNLRTVTNAFWQSIALSAEKCPAGMRNVLKHIRSCAEDRYGSFIRTVKYTSVSGFLFLRFFCPAILNPKLFGLLDDHPPERPRRTFTLVAKSLIGLANMAKFGQKEPWMEPMNKFLTGATSEFKTFVEAICSWTASHEKHHEPQYQAAMQVKQRLPLLSREGLPTLPYLLDAPKSYATLVDIWIERAPANVQEMDVDAAVKTFDTLCRDLKQKTLDCLAGAETAQEPNGKLDERKWQKMLKEQPQNQYPRSTYEDFQNDSEITALPQPPDARRYNSGYVFVNGVGNGSPTIQESIEGEFPTRTLTTASAAGSMAHDDHENYNEGSMRQKEGGQRHKFSVIGRER